MTQTIGIIGAGKLGIVVAKLALRAGYKVYISGSGAKEKIALTVEVLAPGAVAETTEEVAKHADIIILALPLGKFRKLPVAAFNGKLVIDAMNHWWEVDGPRDELFDASQSQSEVVQAFLPDGRVVKALNHMGYHDLLDEAVPAGTPGRKAIAVAGDDRHDVAIVTHLVDSLGFDPVYIGELSKGRILEAGGPVFGVDEPAEKLRKLLEIE